MQNRRSRSRSEAASGPGQIEWVRAAELVPSHRNARTHSKKQIRQIADSIREFGFINPIVVDRHRRVVAGHGRLEAARLLGLTEVPTISVAHLSEAAVRAYALADNRLAEKAGWSRELLAIELKELTVLLPEIELELDITGFEAAEVDALLARPRGREAGSGRRSAGDGRRARLRASATCSASARIVFLSATPAGWTPTSD